jgi:class 3 adenylate cyclase
VRLPFWARLFGLFAAIIIAIVSLSGAIQYRDQRRAAAEGYRDEAARISGLLDPVFLDPLLHGYLDNPQNFVLMLDAIRNASPDLVRLDIRRDDGESLLRNLPGLDRPVDWPVVSGRTLRLIRPVLIRYSAAAGRPIGAIDLVFSTRRFDEALSNQLRESLKVAVIALLLGLAASLAVSRVVTGPLGRLAEGMRRLREGDLSVSVPIESRDEIGDLARTFNETIEGLRAKQELLPYVPETVWRLAHARAGGASEAASAERVVSILFCDLRGFTAYSSSRPPAEVVAFLNRFFEGAAEAVKDEGGVVDKFIGDACLAIFDLPEGDGAPAAIRAAVRIVRFVHNDAEARSGKIGIRAGVNTGPAILGDVGAGGRRDYTVIGAEVNKAQRLEAACEPGTIYVSAEAWALARDTLSNLVAAPLPPLTAKGIAKPLEAYRIAVS